MCYLCHCDNIQQKELKIEGLFWFTISECFDTLLQKITCRASELMVMKIVVKPAHHYVLGGRRQKPRILISLSTSSGEGPSNEPYFLIPPNFQISSTKLGTRYQEHEPLGNVSSSDHNTNCAAIISVGL